MGMAEALERSPKMAPVVSTVRGIATIRDRVIFVTVKLKSERVKNSNKPLWRKAFLRVFRGRDVHYWTPPA
jgi:hypothetical protein